MNRNQRRVQRKQERKTADPQMKASIDGFRWRQETDPADANYSLIEIRLPNAGSMPSATFTGVEARDRLLQWVFAIHKQAMEEMGEQPKGGN